MSFYLALASAVIALHAAFILWIIFGAAFTRRRPLLTALHIGSFLWGVLIEVVSWPCPLTIAENWLQVRAGGAGYQNGFLLHYLDKFVYPNVPPQVLVVAAAFVCLINLLVYAMRAKAALAQGGDLPNQRRHRRH
jgi:hypothetical protein